jgi:hypothetical protein
MMPLGSPRNQRQGEKAFTEHYVGLVATIDGASLDKDF